MRTPDKNQLSALRQKYPEGTRVELVKMDDPQAPPMGTKGTVYGVDDVGTVHVRWDNGSGLGAAYGEDIIKPVSAPKTKPFTYSWHMTEGNWVNYMSDHRHRKSADFSKDADVYGCVRVGNLLFEFCHTLDKDSWYPYLALFCRKDTGLLMINNHITVPVRCKTFDGFKRNIEKRIRKEVCSLGLTDEAGI